MKAIVPKLIGAGLVLLAMRPPAAEACAICYGEPDSPVSRGLTWAIVALGILVMCVLAGAVAFFVQANRRATVQEAAASANALIERT